MKAYAKGHNMRDMFDSLHELWKMQGAHERKSRDKRIRLSGLQGCYILLTPTFRKCIEDMKLSLFACTELKTETEHALGAKCDVVSAACNVLHARRLCTKLETGTCKIEGVVADLYGQKRTTLRPAKVCLQFSSGGEQVQSMVISCDCFYPDRMKLPCSHAISLCIALDKVPHDSREVVGENCDFSFFKLLLTSTCSRRWVNYLDDVPTNSDFLPP